MKLGKRDDCRHCAGPIVVCRMRGGAWAPFDLDLIPADPATAEAYLPVRTGDVVALVPVADLPDRQLEGVRWLARRHRCAQFYRAKAAERHRVDSLGDVADELIARLSQPQQQ